MIVVFPVSSMTAQYYDRTYNDLNQIIEEGSVGTKNVDDKIATTNTTITALQKVIDDTTTDITEKEKQRSSKDSSARQKNTSS
jgi:hypothetical protein